jgi:hypothetical protein
MFTCCIWVRTSSPAQKQERVGNPLQDGILPHRLFLIRRPSACIELRLYSFCARLYWLAPTLTELHFSKKT